MISIIIPVLNEQHSINKCISAIRSTFGFLCEIIVCDGNKQASTVSGIEDSDVIKIVSRPGRAVQMNTAAAAASGDILLFIHADTTLPINAATIIHETFSLPSVSAGAFALSFDDAHPLMRLTSFVGNIRSRIERVPYGDQAPFIRTESFKKIGGFPEIAIMEDVELFQKLKRKKMLIVISRESIKTSSRRYRRTGIIKCFLRNWMLRLLHFAGVSPDRLIKFYSPELRK